MWVREGAGVGAAVDLLQHRRLDLEIAALQQALAQRLDGGGAVAYDIAGAGARHQIEIAAAHPGLGIGEAAPLVGQRAQTLAGQLPLGDEDRQFALVAGADLAGGGDVVAEVDVAGEALQHVRAAVVAGEGELEIAGPVAQHGEDDAAEVAYDHHATRDRGLPAGTGAGSGCRVRRADLGERMGALGDAHGVRVGAVRAQAVQFVVADAYLLGQPLLGRRDAGAGTGQAERVDGRQPCGGDGAGDARSACPLPQSLRRLGTETKPSAMPEARPTRASEPASAKQRKRGYHSGWYLTLDR